MYADDTLLFFANQDVSVIQDNLNVNGDLDLMATWLRENCLFSNTSKTQSKVFGTHTRLTRVSEFDIRINGCPIKRRIQLFRGSV